MHSLKTGKICDNLRQSTYHFRGVFRPAIWCRFHNQNKRTHLLNNILPVFVCRPQGSKLLRTYASTQSARELYPCNSTKLTFFRTNSSLAWRRTYPRTYLSLSWRKSSSSHLRLLHKRYSQANVAKGYTKGSFSYHEPLNTGQQFQSIANSWAVE